MASPGDRDTGSSRDVSVRESYMGSKKGTTETAPWVREKDKMRMARVRNQMSVNLGEGMEDCISCISSSWPHTSSVYSPSILPISGLLTIQYHPSNSSKFKSHALYVSNPLDSPTAASTSLVQHQGLSEISSPTEWLCPNVPGQQFKVHLNGRGTTQNTFYSAEKHSALKLGDAQHQSSFVRYTCSLLGCQKEPLWGHCKARNSSQKFSESTIRVNKENEEEKNIRT